MPEVMIVRSPDRVIGQFICASSMANLGYILVMLLLVGILVASARAADAPPPARIAEIWTCSYKDGKDVGDVLEAREFMVSQANKAGLTLPPSYLWSLIKGDVPINYVWFNVHQNLGAFSASADAWQASGVGPAVMERFSSVSNCVAGMSEVQSNFLRGESDAGAPDWPVFIAASSCSYINRTSQESLADLAAHMHVVMRGMGDNAPVFSTVLVPFITLRALGSPDVFLYSGFGNATEWSKYVSELSSTEAGQQLRNHIAQVLKCDGLTLWSGQQVVDAAAD